MDADGGILRRDISLLRNLKMFGKWRLFRSLRLVSAFCAVSFFFIFFFNSSNKGDHDLHPVVQLEDENVHQQRLQTAAYVSCFRRNELLHGHAHVKLI